VAPRLTVDAINRSKKLSYCDLWRPQ